MKEFDISSLPIYICISLIGLILLVRNSPENQTVKPVIAAANQSNNIKDSSDDEEFDDSAVSVLQQNRPLKMTISVENPSYLKVRVGQEIKKGHIISDNTTERERLDKQKKSVVLQIENLKNKAIPKPFEPKESLGLKKLPPAIFSEEKAAIAQAKMKLSQAEAILAARSIILKSDNPERRAESEKAESALQIATEKVQEQEQLILSMKDMKLEDTIIQHEEAKLKQLRSEMDQANSALDQSKAKLNGSAVIQQQELQQLQINVSLAKSELEVAESRLIAAQNRRQLTEYDAGLEEARRQQQENQTKQEYSRQQQLYAQSIRDRDYQLAQLNISLTTIEDKLAEIPIVKSPRNGYIRRIKPWTGRDGKYTTVVTISPTPISKNRGSVSPVLSPQSPVPNSNQATPTTPNASR